jgi:hypothetical protein
MRGGVSVNELLHIYSFEDRQAIYEVITENIEATKESNMPLL